MLGAPLEGEPDARVWLADAVPPARYPVTVIGFCSLRQGQILFERNGTR